MIQRLLPRIIAKFLGFDVGKVLAEASMTTPGAVEQSADPYRRYQQSMIGSAVAVAFAPD